MSKNIALAKEKRLIIDNDESLYNEIVYKYKYLLEYYINTMIDLKKYEREIDNSNLYIGKNAKYKSLNNYLNLDYIFLVNNLFVEKLEEKDINLLKQYNEGNVSYELINLVKRTFKDVIFDNYANGKYRDDVYKVCYGDYVPLNFVDNDSLVFRIYYGKNLKDLNKDDFVKIHREQLAFFENIMNRIKDEVKRVLDVKCEILLQKDLY